MTRGGAGYLRATEVGECVMADLRKGGIVTKVRVLKNGPDCRRYCLHAWSARLSASQPLLYRRGGIQGRDPGGRAARYC